jgi:hypothetical protein
MKSRKVNHWNYIRSKIKRQFEIWNIKSCEVCGGTFALSFAHRYKRRFITDDSELRVVVLLCQVHHAELEVLPHEEMFQRISELIEQREER